MAFRMIELFLPRDYAQKLLDDFKETDFDVHGLWTEDLDDDKKIIRVLVASGGTEAIIDEFEKRFAWLKDYRVVLLPVEATLPRPVEDKNTVARKRDVGRIHREELYTDVLETAKLNPVFLVMVALSTIVAAVGLVRDSSIIVLSAMVIAPLLGPNVALSLATTLGDRKLGRAAMKSAAVGFFVAIGLSVLIGIVFPISPHNPEIATRTYVGFGDIALALAAGAAGAIAITTGASASLIGVMVAIALLPPTVVTGVLIGAGHFRKAFGAGELLAINLVCLNMAAVLTFVIRGIRPNSWWEAEYARRATRRALLAGGVMLAILAILILLQVA